MVKLLLFPGASLMKITALDDALRVRCPGCGIEREYRGSGHQEFRHEDRCPIYARIQQAIDAYERDEVKRG